MIKYLVVLFLLFSFCCEAQQNDLQFLIEKIKTNYPGYEEKAKGRKFEDFVRMTVSSNGVDTFKMMAEIVDFFHDRHLDLFRYPDSVDIYKCRQNIKHVRTYLDSPGRKKKFEGYWINDQKHCIIALVQVNSNPLRYKGFVIEQRDSNVIPPGLELYEFNQTKGNKYFTRGTLIRNRSTMYIHSEFRNDSVMTAGPYNKWRKLNKYSEPLLPSLPKIPDSATGRWVGNHTYLITIPTSTPRNSDLIDSIIKSVPAITSGLENLIIDIRNNTGGNFKTYSPLLPLLYTDTILPVRVALYITEDEINKNKKIVEDYIREGENDSAYINEWKRFIKMEEDSIGKFYSHPQDLLVYDSVLAYPKNIAFIINFACQSAAEMILLYALQSKKVKLFGEHTAGAIDYLNFSPRDTPSGKYQLYIAASRRIVPSNGSKLDGIGIQPHIHVKDSEKDWVDFVKRYYEKH